MTIKVAINGYGRIGRNVLRAFYEGGKKQDIQIVAINDLGDAKSNAHLTRYDTAHGKFPGTVDGRRRQHDRQWRSDPRVRAAQPGRNPMGRAGRGRGARVHRLLHHQGKGIGPPEGRRQESHHLGAGRQGRRRHHRLRRQPRRAEGDRHRDLERLVHHQLPGAAGQAAERRHRPGNRPDDHRPRLHQRPGADRRDARRPAPRPFGHHEHDPDQDRRRRRGRPGAAGTERQAGRLRDPRADHQRVAGRPVLHRQARHHRRRSQRAS